MFEVYLPLAYRKTFTKKTWVWLALWHLLFGATGLGAESLTHDAFELKAGPIEYLKRGEVYSAWNAKDPAMVLKPGMKVMFFGRAEGCAVQAANGPVKNNGSIRFGQAHDLTGIPLAIEGKGQRWAPSGDSDDCDTAVREQVADSFVHVNEDPVSGGIGMFTFTGPDQNGRRSFFRQIGKDGRFGTGSSPNIAGTFIAYRFDWQRRNTVFLWAGDDPLPDQRKAEFKTTQTVAVVSVDQSAPDKKQIQAKQQVIVSLINPVCMSTIKVRKGLCQFQYLFNTAIYRSGITDWDKVTWFKNAGLFLDPGQGGMPVIHGSIGHPGEVTVDKESGLELYTSLGEPSSHQLFSNKTFRIQVSFLQLKNVLKVIAAKVTKNTVADIAPIDLAAVFGERWNDPNEWLLLSLQVGQEVHNPFDDVRAYIGGSIKEISVGSLLSN